MKQRRLVPVPHIATWPYSIAARATHSRACHNMFLIRTAGLLLSLLGLAACDRLPESYPPPQQRPPVAGFVSEPDDMMVSMDGPDADRLIVKDIYNGSGIPWRWTKQEPTVKVRVTSTQNIQYIADFAIWDEGFKTTGPLQILFLVNGKLLGKVRYTTPGDKHFEKPVPTAWLAGSPEASVALSLDKLYIAPRDGAKFGVILTRLGLRP
jgi:hypothetical protein